MCVIISSPARKHRPSLETLRLCARHNPHGNGLAWIEQSRVHYIKGLSPESIHENLSILRGPVVIHFRYATVGGKRPVLSHPFPVSELAPAKQYGTAREVLFHNGHWPGWEAFQSELNLNLKGPVSDSRLIAIGVYLAGEAWLSTIPGRFALFSKWEGVRLFGDWTESDGCQFSNLNWKLREPLQPDLPAENRRRATDIGDAAVCFGD